MATIETQDTPLVELKFERPPATLQKSAQDALSTAKSYVIDCTDMYELAAGELQQIKSLQKNVENQRTAITVPLNASLKAVNDLFRAPAEWLKSAEDLLKRAMLTFQQEEERKRREEQARLEREAAAERARLAEEAAAEQARADTEARLLREKAEAAKVAGDAEAAARLTSQASARMEESAVTAQVLEQTSQLMSAPTSTRAAPKVSGISTRKVWTFEITDPMLVPREFLVIDETKIGGVVRALKEATTIPGVRVFQKDELASRSAA
jgi:uncharacterized membrane protein YqiK